MGLYYPCSENKGADHLRGSAKLICVFVFAYAKSRFSNDVAHMYMYNYKNPTINKSVRRGTVWHHLKSFVMPDSDLRDRFVCLFYKPMLGPFFPYFCVLALE